MAGVKGRSGGARPNAGRKRKVLPPLNVPRAAVALPASLPEACAAGTPLAFLLSVQEDAGADPRLRVQAAIAAAKYMHKPPGESGKKDERAEAAKRALTGKFKPAAPPKLIVNNT